MKQLDEKIGKIKWLVLDVDGVFTDGKLYFNPQGDYLKAFFVRDGLGIEIARRAGFKIGILTARASEMVLTRAKDLKIDQVIQGCKDKGEGLVKLAELAQVELLQEGNVCGLQLLALKQLMGQMLDLMMMFFQKLHDCCNRWAVRLDETSIKNDFAFQGFNHVGDARGF